VILNNHQEQRQPSYEHDSKLGPKRGRKLFFVLPTKPLKTAALEPLISIFLIVHDDCGGCI
jgi:hypothetical protein